jgi:hypothetical protein
MYSQSRSRGRRLLRSRTRTWTSMRAWRTTCTPRHRQWLRAGDSATRRRRVRCAADHREGIAIVAPADAHAIEQGTHVIVERLGCMRASSRPASSWALLNDHPNRWRFARR